MRVAQKDSMTHSTTYKLLTCQGWPSSTYNIPVLLFHLPDAFPGLLCCTTHYVVLAPPRLAALAVATSLYVFLNVSSISFYIFLPFPRLPTAFVPYSSFVSNQPDMASTLVHFLWPLLLLPSSVRRIQARASSFPRLI